jgi:3-methylcrotonyl-CoA carboxylase alpha subunit
VTAIRRLLIANRGEIAVRVIRACREMGIESVAVCSTIDRQAMHAREADRAMEIGQAPAAESYLRIDAIIDAARRSGADAVHPGYGFLAENAAFAAACGDAGLIFVGPPADVIARMGSKLAARALMERSGVPVVPGGTPADQTEAGVRQTALEVGFPVLIKASAGGGGKGMREVARVEDLDEAIAAARREAMAAFGDGTLYVERRIVRPRHVELQVMADRDGAVVHLFERECSVQRRHQKIVEETPSPALSPALRARMGEAAVTAARAAGYENAGTIEFLVEGSVAPGSGEPIGDAARFYFLEMNTRLQVEHAITEAVTGVDLVRAQIEVASGRPLPWGQADLTQRGHAIECRVYAEDPANLFLPQAGRLAGYDPPTGPGLRVDAGVEAGDAISVHYDPLIAKLVAHAATRRDAIARASAAVRRFVVLGLRTNVGLLARVLAHPRFVAGDIDTSFVDDEREALTAPPARSRRIAAAAAAAWGHAQPAGSAGTTAGAAAATGPPDPWDSLSGWAP